MAWILGTFLPLFMLLSAAIGYLAGHIVGYKRAEQFFVPLFQRLVRGHDEGGADVYVRPPGLTQLEQAARIRAIEEIERLDPLTSSAFVPPYRRMRGLDPFLCTICDVESTYTERCEACTSPGDSP